MADFTVYTEDYNGFNQGISNSIWGVLVYNSPIKTGNLRSQIKRTANTQKKLNYYYNTALAPYIEYLEKGIGRVKRHEGFIEFKTVPAVVDELIGFIQHPTNLSYKGIPNITLRTDRARNYEREMLRSIGMNPNTRINAFERATLGLLHNQQKRRNTNLKNWEHPNVRASDRKKSNRFFTDVGETNQQQSLNRGQGQIKG